MALFRSNSQKHLAVPTNAYPVRRRKSYSVCSYDRKIELSRSQPCLQYNDSTDGTCQSTRKSSTFWFQKLGNASNSIADLSQILNDELPLLLLTAREMLEAIKHASDSAHQGITDDLKPEVKKTLIRVNKAAQSVERLAHNEKIDDVLTSIHSVCEEGRDCLRLLKRWIQLAILLTVFYLCTTLRRTLF